MQESVAQKISDKSLVVGVMALGYVGLPLVRAFWNAGFNCMGFDVDPAKISALEAGENYIKHLGEDFVAEMASSDRFEATLDFDRLGEADVLMVCVPTPLGPHNEPDLSFVEQTARDIGKTLRAGQLVVLESTTYPGTTRDVMLPIAGRKRRLHLRVRCGLLRGVLARAGGPGAEGREHADDPEAGGRAGRGERGAGGGVVPPRDRGGGAGVVGRGGRGGEDSGERVPGGEHRAGERAEGDPWRRWTSTCGRWWRRRRPSRSGSKRFIRARGWAGTASRSIRFT